MSETRKLAAILVADVVGYGPGQFETTQGIFAEQEQVSVDDILFTAARDYAAFAV
jgi:hypothetical protein